VLAYTQHINGNEPLLGEDYRYMVNRLDHDAVIEDIINAKSDSDLIILYLHWGVEYLREAEDWQREWAIDFFEAGADVILGTHPHVVRPDEVFQIGGEYKYVVYSMGNFISNFVREDNRKNAIYTEDGVMLSMDFKIDGNGDVRLESVKPIPTWPYKFPDEDGLNYRIIPVGNPDTFSYENGYAYNEALASRERTMEKLKGFPVR
jgi:poly-gamma-glutamate synthesis protein (capsule biosynthesis protein)